MGSIVAQRVWRQHPERVEGLVLAATTDRFRMSLPERFFTGMGATMLAAARHLPLTYGGAARPARPPTRSTSSRPTSRSGRCASSRARALGRRPGPLRSRPAPLPALAAPDRRAHRRRAPQQRPRHPARPPARPCPRHPGRDDPRRRRRPRGLRARVRDVRPAFVEAAATVNARRRDFRRRATAEPPSFRTSSSGLPADRRRLLARGDCGLELGELGGEPLREVVDVGHRLAAAMIPTCTLPLLDMTVTLSPAPWKTGPSGSRARISAPMK